MQAIISDVNAVMEFSLNGYSIRLSAPPHRPRLGRTLPNVTEIAVTVYDDRGQRVGLSEFLPEANFLQIDFLTSEMFEKLIRGILGAKST